MSTLTIDEPTEDVLDFESPDDVEPVEMPDPPDVDPLYSELTGKTYKTPRGKKAGETRHRNKFGLTPATSKPSISNSQLRKGLQSFYETVGTVVGMVIHPADGQLWIDNAVPCSQAMTEWAESDPRVRAVLERMMTSSVGMKVAWAHAPIVIGMAANHGFNPMGRFFAPPIVEG